MFFKASIILAFAAFAAAQQTPPSLSTCVPAQLSWTGGEAPYFLSVLPGGQSSGTPLKQFGQQSGTSYTWTDLPAGTSITLALTDSTGKTVYSSQVEIQAGTSTSCVTNAVSESGADSSSAAATSSETDSSSSMTMTMESSMDMSSSASASAASDSASASKSASSGAGKLVAGFGALAVAAVAGLLVL